MAEYMEVELTDYDVKHNTIPTYNKNKAEEEIANEEKIRGRKLSDTEKERIRKLYKYIGD